MPRTIENRKKNSENLSVIHPYTKLKQCREYYSKTPLSVHLPKVKILLEKMQNKDFTETWKIIFRAQHLYPFVNTAWSFFWFVCYYRCSLLQDVSKVMMDGQMGRIFNVYQMVR